jgi:Tol biopolymer transport system component
LGRRGVGYGYIAPEREEALRLRQTSFQIITALFLLLLIAIPAHAQFGRNKIQYKDLKWQILTTPHFEIHFYQGSERFAVRTGLVLENGYDMLSEKLKIALPWRVPVILYASHNDFLQTNIELSLIPEGVQAFAEPSRKRIVLPFTGSYPAFAHTAIHELAHVFTFQIVYNRLMDNVFSRNALFGMPLWIAEGFAEYLAVGWDTESDMFIRDAVIHDYLPSLNYASGFMVYKGGQAAFNYIEKTYGREKVLEIVNALAVTRSADGALDRTVGLSGEEFSKQWLKAMRKQYWPMYGDKTEVGDIGRRLTDHAKRRSAYNVKPVMSPDGERIAFFSDRGGLISVYVMSTIDGKIQKKLATGARSDKFESLHFYTSSLAWSPDGESLAFVAKTGGRDQIYIVDSVKGRVRKRIDVKSDGLASPDWSPQGDRIVVTAVYGGQTDLLLVDVDTGDYKRLTYDIADQLNPRFYPDGQRVAFSYFPDVAPPVPDNLSAESRRTLHEMDFLSPANIREGATLDIHEMDLATGITRPLVQTTGDDQTPVVFDGGRRMVFTSDVTGIRNLFVADLETGEYRRVTDVLSGILTPDVNESNNRVTYAAFVNGGYDIYVSDELDRLLDHNFDIVPTIGTVAEARSKSAKRKRPANSRQGQLGADIPLAALLAKGTPTPDVEPDIEDLVYSVSDEDSIGEVSIQPRKGATVTDAPSGGSQIAQATKTGDGKPVEGLHTSVSADEPVDRGASVAPYKFKLAPDYIGQGGGLYFSTGFGFGLANTIAMSDMLGNHRAVISFNIYRDIADSDLLGVYYFLKNRINYGIGAFQYKNYLNARVTSIGEAFPTHRLFTERNYGVFGLVSYPFTTFNRVDLELTAFVTERQFFEEQVVDPLTGTVVLQESASSTRHLIEPTISYTHDNSFYSYFGPIDGSRYTISVSRGFGIDDRGVSRSSLYVDYRRYKKLYWRNSFAIRAAFAASEGEDPRTFFLGGPSTLRGFDYLQLSGTRMALFSAEYRFPFLDALVFGWPGRWGLGNLTGQLFFDTGATWDDGDFQPFEKVHGIQSRDLLANFGVGTGFYFGYFLLNFQMAWQTNFREIGHSQFYFFIGPGF